MSNKRAHVLRERQVVLNRLFVVMDESDSSGLILEEKPENPDLL